MSKMSELSQTLDELTSCGEHLMECGRELIKAVNAVKEIFSADAETAQPETAVTEQKEEAKTFTFVDVRKAFSAKSHAGFTEQVKALITKYGADKLSGVQEKDYPALMVDLEAIE